MDAPKPALVSKDSDSEKKEDIKNDLKQEYKKILIKHLDGREYIEEKIKTWVDNILIEAKEFYCNKYSGYDLFLFCMICEKNVSYRQNTDFLAVKSDGENFAELSTDNLYASLRFFFYKDYNLIYSLDNIET